MEIVRPKNMFGIRHLQVGMLFFGMVILYWMRINMSLAIVAMTDATQEQHFDWSIQMQSVILSSFFWGYIVLQIPAGEIASRIGGSILFCCSVIINSLMSFLVPVAANYGGWQLVCACRVLQGLSQGFAYPSVNHMLAKWVPLEEKSKLNTLVYAGTQLGTASQYIISGFIANSWGWEAIFYVNGVVGGIWAVLYLFIGADSPQRSKLISDEEKNYIQTSLGHVGGHKKLKTPWKSIITSLPFMAVIVAHSGENWGIWTLMTETPSYMSHVLGVDIKANGVMSALPYLAMFAMSFPLGFASDYVLKRQWVSVTTARKLNNSIGFYLPAVALIGLSFVPAGQIVTAVAILTVVVGLNAGNYTGFMLVHIDMAPNFAGSLMGVTNMIGNIMSLIAPLAAGAIITDETDPTEWRIVFFLSSAVFVVSNTFFLIFGSSKKQPWNDITEDTSTNAENQTEKVARP